MFVILKRIVLRFVGRLMPTTPAPTTPPPVAAVKRIQAGDGSREDHALVYAYIADHEGDLSLLLKHVHHDVHVGLWGPSYTISCKREYGRSSTLIPYLVIHYPRRQSVRDARVAWAATAVERKAAEELAAAYSL